MRKFSKAIFWLLAVIIALYTAFVIRRYYQVGVEVLSTVVGTLEKLK